MQTILKNKTCLKVKITDTNIKEMGTIFAFIWERGNPFIGRNRGYFKKQLTTDSVHNTYKIWPNTSTRSLFISHYHTETI